jgi:hypothetical protein
MVTRREVVSALAGVSGLATLGIPVAAAQTPGRRPDLRLQKGEKLVMIGDSITDVGRAQPIGEGERTMLARAFLTSIGFDWQRGLEGV